ncbi:MAG: hypothetical protein RLW61_23960 [Gammaproteobacteria bacterium]
MPPCRCRLSLCSRARRLRGLLVALLLLPALPVGAQRGLPDFSPYVAIDADHVEPGKVAGVIRNVGGVPVRNVVLRVRHSWRWSGGNFTRDRRVEVPDLVLPGQIKGFASVLLPGGEVPLSARYSSDVIVTELTTLQMAPQ